MKAALPSAEQYEALRRNAVAREPIFSTHPLGAILVGKSGVAGWMRQWQELSGEIIASSPCSHPPDEPGWQHELTILLAQMSARQLRPGLSSL